MKFTTDLFLMFLIVFGFLIQVSNGQEPTESPTLAPILVNITVNGRIPGEKIKLFAGSSIILTTVDDSVTLASSDEESFTVRQQPNKKNWMLKANENVINGSAARISAKVAGADGKIQTTDSLGEITVQGFQVPVLSSFRLKLDKTRSLSEIFRIPAELLVQLGFSAQTADLEVDRFSVTGRNTGIKSLYYGLKDGSFDKRVDVSVESNISRIEIESADKKNKAYVGSTYKLIAKTFDANNTQSADADNIEWSVDKNKTVDEKDSIVLMPRARGEVEIYVLESKDDPVTVIAKIKGDDLSAQSFSFFVKDEQNIVGFDNIEMRLNLMDGRTVKDLFGGVAENDYLIGKLRIFNKVPEDQNGGPASSILFFSEALEVNVSLEKRAQEKGKGKEEKKWKQLDFEDIEYINNWAYVESADRELTEHFITGKTAECSPKMLKKLGRECQVNVSELDRLRYFYEKEKCGEISATKFKGNCLSVELKNWIPFRPYAFLVIASTHDRRSERSNREKILKYANGVASLASFSSAFSSTTNNSGYIFGLDKYTNLLVPAFEKLIPSRREVQRKNILDMTLQPVEEVPFGKEVSKVVFIPKRKIEGILPGYDVRIVAVSVSKIKAEASIVQKQKIENR